MLGTGAAGVAALPDLSTVSFADAMVNGADGNRSPDEAVQLASPGMPIATPSVPGPAGNDFNDCSHASSCAALS